MQHMIRSVVFAAAFDAHNIARLRDDTNQSFIPPVAAADSANIAIRKILADLAAVHVGLCLTDRVGKSFCLLVRL